MTPMYATRLMDKVGLTVVNAFLLAGLPVAVIAIFAQAVAPL